MIRRAALDDRIAILNLYQAAFAEDERELVAETALRLLAEEVEPPVISLVDEKEKSIIAHTAFSPIWAEGSSECIGYVLAPLAVSPEYQGKGLGSMLVNQGLQILRERGIHMVAVYGDPAYYGRFGFAAEVGSRFIPPYPLEHPFAWQGVVLNRLDDHQEPVHFTCVTSLQNPQLW